MKRHWLLLACLLSLATPAWGVTVNQSGNVTAGHVPVWVTSGVIGDGGSASDSPISSLGVTNNGGAGICVNSARSTAAGWNSLCFGASTTGAATISLQNYGTAAAQSLQFVINGTAQGFPTVTPLPVTVGDIACFSNTTGGLTDCGKPLPPTPTRAGDIPYWNGTTWVTLAGNNSGTGFLSENSSGVPAWSTSVVTGPGTSTDRGIPTWNGTGGIVLRDNPIIGISSAGALTMNSGFGATSVLYVPPNFTNSSLMVGNGGTNLVHNAGTFTATITGTDMNVTAMTTGTVPWERLGTATLSGSGVTVGTQIRAQVSGTPNGIGHYTISPSQTVGSPTAMTAISLEGYYNTAVGLTNFLNATTASYNTGVGFEVMEFCTTCFANTAIGEATLIYNIDGGGNTAVGWKAMLGTQTFGFGDYNTAVGYSSGWAIGNTGGTTQNTSLGAFSLSAATLSGNANVALGYNAGSGITSGSNNTVVGPNIVPALSTGSNNTAIGACNSGYVGATANLVQLCDGAGNVVFSGAGTGGGISLGSPLNLASGGTAANLSATGGTSQVLKQVSTGAPITVGQLTGNDLTKGVYIIAMSAATGMTVTGTTGETTLATVAIPGNTLGANGALRITAQWTKTGTAGTVDPRIKFGGTTYMDIGAAGATVLSGRYQTEIHNRNVTNSQIGTAIGQANFAMQATTTSVTTALDTTTSQNVTFTCQLGNTGDTCELSSYTIEILKP
jgi:hypothetical protein